MLEVRAEGVVVVLVTTEEEGVMVTLVAEEEEGTVAGPVTSLQSGITTVVQMERCVPLVRGVKLQLACAAVLVVLLVVRAVVMALVLVAPLLLGDVVPDEVSAVDDDGSPAAMPRRLTM